MEWTVLLPFLGTIGRVILAGAGGFLVSKGITDPSSWDTIAGAASVLVSSIWGVFTHATTDARVPSVAADVKAGKKV